MKLKDCLELGLECGCKTLMEAVVNVEIHAESLFPLNKVDEEMEELYAETDYIPLAKPIKEILKEKYT